MQDTDCLIRNPSPLTADEMRAVKYYEGDIADAERDDLFYGDARAYVTLNARLYDDLAAEYTRVREGKRLNPEMLRDLPRLVHLYDCLLTASQKGAQEAAQTGCRVERLSDFQVCLQSGKTGAFTSTSQSGFLPDYGDKQQIVLLTYHVPAGTPVIIFSQMLDNYLKSNEDELLLPPFLRFAAKARPLTDADRRITDLQGEPPAAAYDLFVLPDQRITMHADAALLPEVYDSAVRLYAQIQQNLPESQLSPEDMKAYLAFKQSLRKLFAAN